ncbi:MAG: tetratricopeptide repeat protein [Acidobacteria bacterium]|nr:tetratricopeptide repeat protein [Acidobacteriota bacterium]
MRKFVYVLSALLTAVFGAVAQTPEATPVAVRRTHVDRFRSPESRALKTEAEATEKLKQNPASAETVNDRAVARMRLQNFSGALDDLKRAVELDPKNAEYRANLGYVLWKVGRGEEAIAAEREALRLDEKNYTANYQLGRFLLRTGDRQVLPEAIQKFKRALELDPRLYEVRFELIAAYREIGDLASAGNQLALLQDAKPSEPRVIYVDALLSADRGDMKTAVERFRSALDKDPELYGAWQDLGLLYLKLGRWEDAAATFAELAKRQSNSAEAAYLGALALYNLKRTSDAESEVRRALRLNAGFADARTLLGIILSSKPDGIQEAIESLTQAIALKPNSFDANFYLGRLEYTEGRFNSAFKHLETAAKINPANTEARFFLGTVFESLGESEKALAEYQEIVKLEPASFFGQVGLGALYVKQGKLDEAVAALSNALKTELNSFEANLTIGRAFILKEMFPQAEESLKRAVELQPKRTDARYQWAIALRRLGRNDEARREFELVEKLNKEFREGRENQ